MKWKPYWLIIFMMYVPYIQASKIIYLISPPRSLSVAFLRMMQARKDFEVFEEPSIRAYNELHCPGLDWWNNSSLKTFEAVKKAILDAELHGNVFAKEMIFSVYDFLLHDELITKSNVYVVFLMRNPHDTISSFYRVTGEIVNGFSDFVDYQLLYDLFCFVKERGGNLPFIIKSEDLIQHPEQTVRTFCNKVGISFLPQSLTWQDLGSTFVGEKEWHENQNKKIMHMWNGDAIRSEKFHQPRRYHVDVNGNPTFQETKSEEDRAICLKAYEKALPIYNKMLASGYVLDIGVYPKI